MNSIEKLYYNMDKLVDNWKDSEEVIKAQDAMGKAIGAEVCEKAEDEICCCMSANEKQGFVHGFQYAVSLLTNAQNSIGNLDELMQNEYDAVISMNSPMSGLVSEALKIVRVKITDREYLEVENNMLDSYNYAEKFGFEQGFMRGIAVVKGGMM